MLSVLSPQAWLLEAGLTARTGELIRPHATTLRILTSPRAWQAVEPALSHSLERAGISWQLDYLDGECSDGAIAGLQQRTLAQGAQGILAIGGGRVLDCGKAAAAALPGVAVFCFATQAATCAAWSPYAVIYHPHGGHQKSVLLEKLPLLALADSEVIARAGVRYLESGIVDALAKWYEFAPYLRQNPHRLGLELKVAAAAQARDALLRWGEEGVAAVSQQRVNLALEKTIEASIVLAGLANSIQDALPTAGVAHEIHNRLTHQPQLHGLLHGEVVGYSLLIQSLLEYDGVADAQLLQLLQRFNSPLSLTALGPEPQAILRQIARDIHVPPASAVHLPFTVTEEKLYRALASTVVA